MVVGIVAPLFLEARWVFPAVPKQYNQIIIKNNLRLVISGMGEQAASHAAKILADSGVNILVSWGTAGGLSSDHTAGEVLFPCKSVTTSMKKSLLTEPMQEVVRQLVNDFPWLNLCQSIVSVDTILNTSTEKQAFYKASSSVLVDMETAAISYVADKNRLPCVAVRVIFDDAHFIIPRPFLDMTNEFGEIDTIVIMKLLLKRQVGWKAIFRLWRRHQLASRRMCKVARKIFHPQSSFFPMLLSKYTESVL